MYKEGLNFSQLEGLQKLCGIYRLSIAEHSYIGSSKNLYSRLYEHRHDLIKKEHSNSFLQNVVDKYGLEAVTIDIIELCPKEVRTQREKYWIDFFHSDMNLQDPVTFKLSEESKKKISANLKKAYDIGTRVHYFSNSTIECYDYFGDFITTFSTKEEAATACNITVRDVANCLSAYKHGTKSNGSSIGKAVNGYRFRYSISRVPPMKFAIKPKRVGAYFNFYYEDETGNKEIAFTNVRECWEFFTKHCKDKKITIIPILKSRESWDLRCKTENHNGSTSEMK